MYTQTKQSSGNVYIPSNYKGNALYFEKIQGEYEKECQEECKNETAKQKDQKCDSSKCPEAPSLLGSLSPFFSKLFSGENIILLAVLLFFLFSSKEKSEDNTTLLLLLLLLI